MREAGVIELYAHNCEDAARRLAAAPIEVADAVDKLVRSDRAQEWPVRARLAMSALEILDGHAPTDPLVRSRSPALEMPADLRYLAHRTDTRDRIVHGLARVRHGAAGWGFLIVDALSLGAPADAPYYVQFTSHPGPGIRAEAIGDVRLPEERRLAAAAQARMRELGWREGTEHDAGGIWVAQLRGGTRHNRESIADLALDTLESAFGCGPGTRYRVTTDVWSPRQSDAPTSSVQSPVM